MERSPKRIGGSSTLGDRESVGAWERESVMSVERGSVGAWERGERGERESVRA